MDYNEYREAVKKIFIKCNPNLDTKSVDKYFSLKDTDDIIRQDYENTQGKNLAGVTPSSTAYCLTMLY